MFAKTSADVSNPVNEEQSFLTAVEMLSGEESEETVVSSKIKLFQFSNESKDWKEKGTGILKLNRSKGATHQARLGKFTLALF